MTIGKKLFIQRRHQTQQAEPAWEKIIDQQMDSLNATTDAPRQTANRIAIDLWETPTNYVIIATLPGISPDKIDIWLDNDTLTIHGQLPSECHQYGRSVYQECLWGEFSRSITLPKNTKRTGHRAMIKNGLLKITLPKLKSAAAKKIPLKSYD